jgi:hypothetical protein
MATPKINLHEIFSGPNASRSNSDAASATLMCSWKPSAAAIDTPNRTTWLTLSSEPRCFLATAMAFSVAMRAASHPASVSISLPKRPTTFASCPTHWKHPAQKQQFAGLNFGNVCAER